MSGKYRLVQREGSVLDSDLCGIYYHKGRLVVAMPVGWFIKLLYAYILLNIFLAVWVTCFPHITIIRATEWMTCAILTLFILRVILHLWVKYNKQFNPIPITKLPFILPCIILLLAFGIGQNRVDITRNAKKILDHEIWLHHLQYSVDTLSDTVTAMDEKFTRWNKDLNDSYTKILEEKESVQQVEELASKMWEGFGLITVTRQHFGLGCFVKGTLIQIDELGTMKKIEDLDENDMVYNPDLNKTMKMKVITMGPEDGYIYQIITNDSFQVYVTKTHPMKICHDQLCENIAASDVFPGNRTQTINGFQEIVEINKISADDVMVYNIMLDMDEDIPIIQRSIIANGIHTFDLYAQAMHE